MTDQPPGNPGDVWATGQRREPGGLFPQRGGGGGGGGGGGDDGETHQQEVGDDNSAPGVYADPCAAPETAVDWNADAAAAAAAKEFARLAALKTPPEDLNTREWGAYLYRNPDGSIRIGAINSGPAFQAGGVGSVALIADGLDADIVGFVHSHSSGNHLPSDGPDLNNPGDIQVLDSLVAASGNPHLRMYIVAPNQGPVGFAPYNQVNFYNASNALPARQSGTPGPEVNPEGLPCPGA